MCVVVWAPAQNHTDSFFLEAFSLDPRMHLARQNPRPPPPLLRTRARLPFGLGQIESGLASRGRPGCVVMRPCFAGKTGARERESLRYLGPSGCAYAAVLRTVKKSSGSAPLWLSAKALASHDLDAEKGWLVSQPTRITKACRANRV